MKLSILCPALIGRDGMSTIIADLRKQAVGKPVEVLCFADNGAVPTGEKLNLLRGAASGEFVATVADDDGVSNDYVEMLLHSIVGRVDALTFNVSVTWNGNAYNPNEGDTSLSGSRKGAVEAPAVYPSFPVRTQPVLVSCGLGPLSAVRAKAMQGFDYPDVSKGEDAALSVWLRDHIGSARTLHIERTLYMQHYRSSKPEFGGATYRPHVMCRVGI